MTPDVSRAVATIKDVLELSPGPVLDELIRAARTAATVDDLPQWALNVLAVMDPAAGEAAGRMVDDDGLDGVTITPPPGD